MIIRAFTAGAYPETMWYHIYRSLNGGAPYPVTVEQGASVVETMVKAHEFAKYKPFVIEYK